MHRFIPTFFHFNPISLHLTESKKYTEKVTNPFIASRNQNVSAETAIICQNKASNTEGIR